MTLLPKLSGRIIAAVLSTVMIMVIGFLFINKVDLEPKITPDFFFSSDSAIYKQDKAIQNEFPFQQQILLNVTTDNIGNPNYIRKIQVLSNRIQSIKGINSVQSITHGPKNLNAALNNPLWKRLLIGDNQKSSFIIAFVSTDQFAPLIRKVEKIVNDEQSGSYKIRISGLPYIVEQIRRNLTNDMKTFTFGAIIVSALMLLAVFRSVLIVIGAVITCVIAAMLTLIIQSSMGISIGILTANLGTIVFVLTLSHIIFMISNWSNASKDDGNAKLRHTLKYTLTASFWAALTTLLGFGSLIFVDAKPLNELGVGGTVGTISAIICAYTIFPAFLRFANVNPTKFTYSLAKKFPLPELYARRLTQFIIIMTGVIGLYGIERINTDPSLLSYFKNDSDLYQGLYHVDDNGGSSPLLFVIKRKDNGRLDNGASYDQMWGMQQRLSAQPSVGSVISLPVIMAEGNEHWLGRLLPWNILLDILSKPEHGAVAKSFINTNRDKAVFIIRMNEGGRTQDRLSIINELKSIPSQYGLKLSSIGGAYYLQGELASSVSQSMIIGILSLIALFGIVGLIISGQWIIAFSVMICASFVSIIVLGTLGALKIPIDIISSPAINICLGLIVDNIIHLTLAAKRRAKTLSNKTMSSWTVWKEALDSQSWPAIISTLTIMIGFSVFGLSDFPPSQRFGLEIVYGAGVAMFIALGVYPYLITRFSKLKTTF